MSVDLSHSSQLQEIYQSDSSQEDSDSLPDDADESALVAQIEDLQRKLDEQRSLSLILTQSRWDLLL